MRSVSALAVLLLLGCSGPKQDFQTLCHAHLHAGVLETDGPGEQAVKIAKYLGERLKTREAKDLLARLPTLPVAQKAAALEVEAAKYGVTPCPLADVTWP